MKFKFNTSPIARALLIGGLALSATACNDDDDDVVIVANTSPTVTSTSVDMVEEGVAYSYTFAASDAEGDTLTMTASTLPAWLVFDATSGALTGTPATADVGDHSVSIEVSDGSLSATQDFTITVSAIVVANSPPTITSAAVVTATVGVEYSYTLMATDTDASNTLAWTLVSTVPWMSFDASTGILSGTPDAAGSYDAEVMVSDGTDTATQAFTIVVAEASVMTTALVVFENEALPAWAAWINDGGATEVVTDDVEHDQATKFTLTGPSVAGFTARETDGAVGGMAYDASAIALTGSITFELKMLKAPDAGVVDWKFKVEGAGANEQNLSASVEGHATPLLDTWQTYTFPISSLAGLDPNSMDLFMVFPDFNSAAGAEFLLDNFKIISVTDGGGGQITSTTIDTFEGDIATYEFNNFDGGVSTVVANPDATGINTSAQVVKMEKFAGQPWGGSTVLNLTPFALPADSSFTLKVWSMRAVDVLLKLEGGPVGEKTVTHGGLGWEELSFDFAGIEGAGTNGITFIFDNGTAGDAAGDADKWTFYYDDIVLIEGSGGDTGGGDAGSISPVDFEAGGIGAAYTWTTFENADNPAVQIVANPDMSGANTSATVAQFSALMAGNSFAGAETAHGDFGPLTLDASNSIVKIMVYKTVISDVGLKFAIASGGAQGEIKVANTVINQWEELTFDFSANIGAAESINIDQLIIFPDFNERAADTVTYFDNITFGSN
jgi:hypothetical protein